MFCICCRKDRARSTRDVEATQELLESSNSCSQQATPRNARAVITTSDLPGGISDTHILPPAGLDVGTSTSDFLASISDTHILPPAGLDVGTSTSDFLASISDTHISPPARLEVGTSTSDFLASISDTHISPPARLEVGTSTSDFLASISDTHILPPAGLDVATSTSDFLVSISDTHISPPARLEVGTSTSDFLASISDTHISPPARLEVGTSTSDFLANISDTHISPPARLEEGTSTSDFLANISDTHISPPARLDVGTSTFDFLASISDTHISPPVGLDVGTSTFDFLASISDTHISPPAGLDVGTSTSDFPASISDTHISPPVGLDVGTSTFDFLASISDTHISPPAGLDVGTSTFDFLASISGTHISPPARLDVGTSTTDSPARISDTHISPPVGLDVGTSTSDLISGQDVLSLDVSGNSPDDGQNIPKTSFGDSEIDETSPSTAGGTKQHRPPQQESSADSGASRAEDVQERYIILPTTENSASVECVDSGSEMYRTLREKEEQLGRLEQELKDLHEQFAHYIMRITDDLRESIRTSLLKLNDQLLQHLASRICKELGLQYVSINHNLDVAFAPGGSTLVSPIQEMLRETKEKIENIIKDNLPEDIREGISWHDPVQCTDSTADDNEVQSVPAQVQESPQRGPHLQIIWEDRDGFVARHPTDHPEDKRVWIRAMATLPDGRLVATDAFNKSLKVISITEPDPEVVSCYSLGVKPYGVAVLDDGQTAAVTTEETKSLFLLDLMSEAQPRKVNTQKQYKGVGPGANNNIVVSCTQQENQAACVDVISKDGALLQTVHTFSGNFALEYLTVSGNDVFVSDRISHSILHIRMPGSLLETLTHEGMQWPRQVCVCEDGSLVVACSDSECVLKRGGGARDWRVVLTGRENGDTRNGRTKASALAVFGNGLVVAWGKFGDSVLKRHSNIV